MWIIRTKYFLHRSAENKTSTFTYSVVSPSALHIVCFTFYKVVHMCSVFVEIFNDQLCSIWTTLSVYAQIGLFFVCWECVSPQLVLTIIKSDQFHVFISISKQRVSVCGLCVCVHLDLIREGSQKYTLCDKYLVELLNSDKKCLFRVKTLLLALSYRLWRFW